MRDQVKHLQKTVDEAEYKHQMSTRQWRRGELNTAKFKHLMPCKPVLLKCTRLPFLEKSQLEKMQRETESAAKEAEDRVTELEAEVEQVRKEQAHSVEEGVMPLRARCEKLEDIVRDLEHCLRLSKESEERVATQSDEYRAKCK